MHVVHPKGVSFTICPSQHASEAYIYNLCLNLKCAIIYMIELEL